MSDERVETLWSRYAAGEPLTPAEEEELARALRADPELSERLIADRAVGGLLAELGRTEEQRGAFAAKVDALLLADAGGQQFRVSVEQRLDAEDARVRRRVTRRWIVAACATAAAIALVVGWRSRVGRRDGARVQPTLTASVAPVDASVASPWLVAGDAGTPDVPRGDVIFTLDFEDPARLKLIGGRVAPCPPGPGRSRCLAGDEYSKRYQSLGARLSSGNAGHFRYLPGAVMVFDCWMGAWLDAAPQRLNVDVLVRRDRPREYTATVEIPTGAAWRTVVIPLAAFAARDQRLIPGDEITFLKMGTRSSRQDVFFVDDLRVVVPR